MMKKIENTLVIFPDPELDFRPINMSRYNHSFVSGDLEPERIRIEYYLRQRDNHLIAHACFGKKAEGPPGFAHGGSQAAVLDEAMGATPWANLLSVVAAEIHIQFKKMLPLQSYVRVECRINKIQGRKVFTSGEISDGNGTIYSAGEGVYIILPIERFQNIPEAEQLKFRLNKGALIDES
ncbi:MAG TPA: PaaI family thioesterase [Candidatus Marinimicrobia bacterium]|nr:PaaI family thioesterase [Candidatus Neomarinimicrobiota bacterium]